MVSCSCICLDCSSSCSLSSANSSSRFRRSYRTRSAMPAPSVGVLPAATPAASSVAAVRSAAGSLIVSSARLYCARYRVVIHSQAVFSTSWAAPYGAYQHCTAATKCDGATSDTRRGALSLNQSTHDLPRSQVLSPDQLKSSVQKHRYLNTDTTTCCRTF